MERSLDLVVGLLGILQAGAAYVPLDPELSARAARLHAGRQSGRGPADARSAASPARLRRATLCLDRDADAPGSGSRRPRRRAIHRPQLAYTIYTSGSTGRPKGAGNTHGGLRNRLQWMQEAYPLTAADRVLQKTPISFDVSVWEFFWPLSVGAELVLAAPGEHKSPSALIARIVEQG